MLASKRTGEITFDRSLVSDFIASDVFMTFGLTRKYDVIGCLYIRNNADAMHLMCHVSDQSGYPPDY